MSLDRLKRRQFIALVGAAVAWPRAVRAQPAVIPVVGFMSSRSAEDSVREVAAFRRGLAETGYVEGRNVAIEFRWAQGRFDRLPALAGDLVQRPVAVLAAVGDSGGAAKAATSTIPVVFGIGGDPVATGLVASLNRPGGNITGATLLASALGAKRLGLLRDLVPGAQVIALLVNPTTVTGQVQSRDVQEAARALG